MWTKIIALTVLVACTTVQAIEPQRKDKGMASEESTAHSQLDQADATFQGRDYQAALEQYQAVVEKAREEFNVSVEVEALAQVARMNLLLNNKEKGRQWLEEAESKATESDPMGWSRFLGVKGRFEWQDNDLKAAHETFDRMYTYCHVNGLWGRAVDAAHMIAIVAEKPEEQIEWSRKGIEAAEASQEESWLGPLWNNLGGIYYDLKQFDSALECYLKAREYHWRYSDESSKLFADYHVGMTYRLLSQCDEAGKWLRPVLAWAERIENHSAIGQACEDLGECEIALGNEDEGLKLLKRSRTEYQRAGFDTSWPEIWEHINERITQVEG